MVQKRTCNLLNEQFGAFEMNVNHSQAVAQQIPGRTIARYKNCPV